MLSLACLGDEQKCLSTGHGAASPHFRHRGTSPALPYAARMCMCRALKTKHETPKYGLIYHASLIGQSSSKFKGKVSRVLAAKCALATRVDALGDSEDASIGESRCWFLAAAS